MAKTKMLEKIRTNAFLAAQSLDAMAIELTKDNVPRQTRQANLEKANSAVLKYLTAMRMGIDEFEVKVEAWKNPSKWSKAKNILKDKAKLESKRKEAIEACKLLDARATTLVQAWEKIKSNINNVGYRL